jgi:hypothetical protein
MLKCLLWPRLVTINVFGDTYLLAARSFMHRSKRTVVQSRAASSFKLQDIVVSTLQPSSRRFVDHQAPLSPTPSLK